MKKEHGQLPASLTATTLRMLHSIVCEGLTRPEKVICNQAQERERQRKRERERDREREREREREGGREGGKEGERRERKERENRLCLVVRLQIDRYCGSTSKGLIKPMSITI